MNIWLINHYAVPPQYYPLARQTFFAKYLQQEGHTVKIISASSVHNSKEHINMITDGQKWREEIVDGVDHVYIRCCDYEGNGLKRIYNMCEFAWKLPGVCKKLQRPDAIVATSMPPMSCAMGIRIARKYGIKGIAEIADLWPESLVAYGIAGVHHPAVMLLRRLEKWIYMKADAVIFTMEGAYDYIREQGWEKDVPEDKVHYINNGVDLEAFGYNKNHFQIDDEDLKKTDAFNVVYCGSIRKVNNLGELLDAAKLLNNHRIMFLIWGAGDELETLQQRLKAESISNVLFKGAVDKKYIPYITSKADLNIFHGSGSSVLRFGVSANKGFEYLAAGRPILVTVHAKYNPVIECGAGVEATEKTPGGIARAIDSFFEKDREERKRMGQAAAEGAKQYDFHVLTEKLLAVIHSI